MPRKPALAARGTVTSRGHHHGAARHAIQVADQRNSEWINLQLAQAQRRYPNLRIVHWAEYLAARPGRLRTDLRDGRHTTVPAGQTARNGLILQAILDH